MKPPINKTFSCRHVRIIPPRGAKLPIAPAISPAPIELVLAELRCPACRVGILKPASGRRGARLYCDQCLDEADARAAMIGPVHITTVPCAKCDNKVPLKIMERVTGRLSGYRLCPACWDTFNARTEKENNERLKAAVNDRKCKWRTMCPARYRIRDLDEDTSVNREEMTDHARIPQQVRAVAEAWRFGSRGLYLHGNFGLGKTRAMMLLLRRLMVDENIRCQYVLSVDFAERVRSLAMDDARKVEHYVDSLIRVPVLFLDDLGKEKCTEKVAEEIYRIVERRTAAARPILATCNLSAEALGQKIDRDGGTGVDTGPASGRGIAIVRRLADYGDFVTVC